MTPPPFSVVIPVRDEGERFRRLVGHLARMRERTRCEVVVVDSGSTDGSDRAAEEAGFRVERIDPGAFGHGRTRNLGASLASEEIVVFLVGDALPVASDWPRRLLAPFEDEGVAGTFGRQRPRGDFPMEGYLVRRTYPDDAYRLAKRNGTVPRPRAGRLLFSNVFSAVRRSVWEEIPFPEDALFGEDQAWALEALEAGWGIEYVPGVVVEHSHRYTLRGVYRRAWAHGYAFARRGLHDGGVWGDAVRHAAGEAVWILRRRPWWLPYAAVYEAARFAGYRRGRRAGLAGEEPPAGSARWR